MTATINRIECIHEGQEFFNILVDGNRLTPEESQKVRNHSPTGFSWGYSGSGPAQLALAILLAVGLTEDQALSTYQQFKAEYLALLDQEKGWTLELDVRGWFDQKMAEAGEFVD